MNSRTEFKDRIQKAIAAGEFETKPGGYGRAEFKAVLTIADLERQAGSVGVDLANKFAKMHATKAYRDYLESWVAKANKPRRRA